MAKILNTCIISLFFGMSLIAPPVFNRSEKTLSFWEVFLVLAILNMFIVYNSNRIIENVKKRLDTGKKGLSSLGIFSAFAIGAWLSYAFGYMTIDYLGDMRAIFVSVILYSYAFMWIGASIVVFISGHE